jgi:hypothetical protein
MTKKTKRKLLFYGKGAPQYFRHFRQAADKSATTLKKKANTLWMLALNLNLIKQLQL